MLNITMRDLLQAGAHFGHQRRFWNPKMAQYIFGVRNKIHIINLEKTLPLLEEAANFIGSVAARKGKVLFVGTKLTAREAVKEAAQRCGMPYINHRWLGGLLTNYKAVRNSIKRLKTLEAQFEKQNFGDLTKKEILILEREKNKLEKTVGGIKKVSGLPDVLFIIDVGNEHIAIKEANKLGIPVVAVVDTVDDPDKVDYVIPGNDDAIRAIKLYLNAMADSILNAKSSIGDFTDEESTAPDEFVEVTVDNEAVALEAQNEQNKEDAQAESIANEKVKKTAGVKTQEKTKKSVAVKTVARKNVVHKESAQEGHVGSSESKVTE